VNSLRTRVSWLTRRAQGLELDDTTLSPVLEEELRRSERELLERVRRARLTRQPGHAGPSLAEPGLDVAALREALGAGEALLEYGVIDDELFACVVSREHLVLQRQVARWPDVLQALRSARFQIESLSHGAHLLAGHLASLTARCQARMAELHSLVWQPLAPLVGGCTRVLVVAPAQLGALPFAALHDGQATLAERHELAFAPSARTALHGLSRRMAAPQPALVMAESSQLLHAAAEAHRVAALFPGAALCVDEAATLERWRELAPGAALIHLACHARFRSDNPAFSALHLNDGALTVEMVEQMTLRPGLVVLSGCETGLVDGAGGDEQVGLVRAFLVAGAARVVASLWPVDDEVTGQFMARFLVALSRGIPPAQALRLAQVALMRQHAHPFHWAAFTLQGGW
jgi:CHAT domain